LDCSTLSGLTQKVASFRISDRTVSEVSGVVKGVVQDANLLDFRGLRPCQLRIILANKLFLAQKSSSLNGGLLVF
jgi:hypothetical protein